MNYILEISFVAAYSLIYVLIIISGVQIKNFLRENTIINDKIVLERFRKIAYYSHYAGIFGFVFIMMPAMLLCIKIYGRYDLIGLWIVLLVNVVLLILSGYVQKVEQVICSLPTNTDEPTIEQEYQKIIYKWNKKYVRTNLAEQSQELTEEKITKNPLILNINLTLCWLLGILGILLSVSVIIPYIVKFHHDYPLLSIIYPLLIFFASVGLCIAAYSLRKRKKYAAFLNIICSMPFLPISPIFSLLSVIIIVLTLLNWKSLNSSKHKTYHPIININTVGGGVLGIVVVILYNSYLA